ncbi:unnamed protein product [Effrenium voratum]|nr:unnamed protein product [Effrenium voratum]
MLRLGASPLLRARTGLRAASSTSSTFDFIVVGAGAAGAVIASRLSEDSAAKVLLLEAGPPAPPESFIPAACGNLQGTAVDWARQSPGGGGGKGLVGGKVKLPSGKMLGGSTANNYMAYVRGDPRDYDSWASKGADGWSWGEVLPYFKKSEGFASSASGLVDKDTHGFEGPWAVSHRSQQLDCVSTFVQAAQAEGYTLCDYNSEARAQETDAGKGAVSPHQFTIQNGRRCSISTAFLEPHMGKRPNLTVRCQSLAQRVLLEGKRAVGVEYLDEAGGKQEVFATKEVVVAGGSYASPGLLLRSGIGPRRELAEAGIETRLDLPEVGKNLTDHMLLLIPISGVGTTFTQLLSELAPEGEGFKRYMQTGEGLAATSLYEASAFYSSGQHPVSAVQDGQISFGCTAYVPDLWAKCLNYADFNEENFRLDAFFNPEVPSCNMVATLNQPLSRGEVRLAGSDVEVNHNYLAEEADLRMYLAICKEAMRIVEQPSFGDAEVLIPKALSKCYGSDLGSEALWEAWIRSFATTIYHPVSSCAMGRVVDAECRVFHLEGLRVADGSVMPEPVSGNTQAACAMIGEKVADLMASQHGLSLKEMRLKQVDLWRRDVRDAVQLIPKKMEVYLLVIAIELTGATTCLCKVAVDSSVESCVARCLAEWRLPVRLAAGGRGLLESGTLRQNGVQEGDCVACVACCSFLRASLGAFALAGGLGSGKGFAVSWGEISGTVRADVQEVQSTDFAFAAITTGGVLAWGHPNFGGDCSEVQDRLRGTKCIQSSSAAFAAILETGEVVTWGHPLYGGDSSQVQADLVGVEAIQSCRGAFCALTTRGVVAWGQGPAAQAPAQAALAARQVQATEGAFAALADGTVVAWGDPEKGGDCPPHVQARLVDVRAVQASRGAFVALLGDGSAVAWGSARSGGDSSGVEEQLRQVVAVQASAHAFCALLVDGRVVAWGSEAHGGDASGAKFPANAEVQCVQATSGAFCALLRDGRVVCWGDPSQGGDCRRALLNGAPVAQVAAARGAFCALLADGRVVPWGSQRGGGDGKHLAPHVRQARQVAATAQAFAVLLSDGGVVAWGSAKFGGDGSRVRALHSQSAQEVTARAKAGSKPGSRAREGPQNSRMPLKRPNLPDAAEDVWKLLDIMSPQSLAFAHQWEWTHMEAARTYGSDFESRSSSSDESRRFGDSEQGMNTSQMLRVPIITGSQECGRPGVRGAESGPGLDGSTPELKPDVNHAVEGQLEGLVGRRHVWLIREAAKWYFTTYDAFCRVSMSVGAGTSSLATFFCFYCCLPRRKALVMRGMFVFCGITLMLLRTDQILSARNYFLGAGSIFLFFSPVFCAALALSLRGRESGPGKNPAMADFQPPREEGLESVPKTMVANPGHLWSGREDQLARMLKEHHSELMEKLQRQDHLLLRVLENPRASNPSWQTSTNMSPCESDKLTWEKKAEVEVVSEEEPEDANEEPISHEPTSPKLFNTYTCHQIGLQDAAASMDGRNSRMRFAIRSNLGRRARNAGLFIGRVVHHPGFDIFFSMVVILNSIYIGFEVEASIQVPPQRPPVMQALGAKRGGWEDRTLHHTTLVPYGQVGICSPDECAMDAMRWQSSTGSLVYVFAVLFTQAVNDFANDPVSQQLYTEYELEASKLYFRNLSATMLSLFMSIAGGVSWEQVLLALYKISYVWVAIFLFYIAFTYFAVLNVVTAVFCQSAIDSAQNDHATMMHAVLANKQAHLEKVKDLFSRLGAEETGSITYLMFKEKIDSPEVREYFESLGLDVWDAWSFFKMLDLDDSGAVDMEEFLMGCLRVRGSAKAIDLSKPPGPGTAIPKFAVLSGCLDFGRFDPGARETWGSLFP